MINVDELKNKFEQFGYYITEELLYESFNSLYNFGSSEINPGQDIFAVCLEGPPGAGKTEYAKVYTKIANEFFKENVKMVEYQCDATTGKTELFEDINISAALRHDADNVNIPGKLIQAIKQVNAGNKVVLFIDEYDKAREETDAFLLQFLQSGKINSTQHGDLEIKDEYKSNLQVILCKNDMREELSGPLSRRIRIVRLDYMTPEMFFKVANRVLITDRESNKVDSGLLNLVSLMYEKIYLNKDHYNRLPSCSEMLTALIDADLLTKCANAPQYIIYRTIIKNLFKSVDDITTFESDINKDKKLNELIKEMKKNEVKALEINLNEEIGKTIFKDSSDKLIKKTEELENLIKKYKEKFADMEQKKNKEIADEINKINLENGKLVATKSIPNVINNFEDESAYIKRGHNIFELSDNEWIDVASIYFSELPHNILIDYLIKNASKLDIKLYENGILIEENKNIKLIMVNDFDEKNESRYRIMANVAVIPVNYLKDILFLTTFIYTANNDRIVTKLEQNSNLGTKDKKININALVYSDKDLSYDKVLDNVYNVNIEKDINEENIKELSNLFSKMNCSNFDKAIEVSNKIINQKTKVIK